MEINKINRNVLNAYKTISGAKSPEKKADGYKSGNVDTIEFDFERSIGAAKANIAGKLDAEANTARIEQLQKSYADGGCPVSPEAAAAAVLGN
ncbi:MAG: hypothetical protein LBI38_06355 [Oscillospiraceae bacterium]|jgi:anti-sigma28 factor (negative regulator of flagellin synthesis)|nr:hypothetical protein [Oscillospiraceae bacterium]